MQLRRWLYTLPLRLRTLLRRRQIEQELGDEFDDHVERKTADYVLRGFTLDEARQAALRDMEGLEQHKEECRDMRRLNFVDNLLKDLHLGLRMLWKKPGVSVVAILTLALGIGANTAIFSAVHALLIRPLPYTNSTELVVPATILKKYNTDRANVAYADYLDMQSQTEIFSAVAVHFEQPADVTGGDRPERVKTSLVSEGYFRVMAAAPLLGRVFTSEENLSSHAHVAVLTHAYWMRRFGGDPNVLQHTIEIAGVRDRIIGVMPANSTWPEDAAVLLPLGLGQNPPAVVLKRDNFSIGAIARLKQGVSVEQAQAQINVLADRIEHQYPAIRVGTGLKVYPLTAWIIGSQLRQMLLVMMGAVGLVLAIACANLANLLLARGVGRSHEFAIRTALGARWGRLARQVLTEQMAVGFAGAVAGALLGIVGVQALVHFAPPDTPRLSEIGPDSTAFLFTAVLSLLTTLVFALIPALHAGKSDPVDAFREGGRSSSAGVRGSRSRAFLVVSEVTLSLVLLVGAGLLLRTSAKLQRIDIGFRPQNLMTFELSLPSSRYPTAQQTAAAFASIIAAIRRVPGVVNVGGTSALPVGGGGFYVGKSFVAAGQPQPPSGRASPGAWDVVLPGYFQTLGVRPLAGRLFDDHDNQASQPVIILSEPLARQMFPNETPVGKRIRTWRDENFDREVVGVVRDIPYFSLVDHQSEVAYVPHGQESWNTMDVVIRSGVSPSALLPSVRQAIASEDKHVALAEVRTMNDVLARSLARPRFLMFLLAMFAGIAVVLAGVGIYGVLSYAVSHRAREIGIRVALGARPTEILCLVAWRGMVLTICGIGIGTAFAAALMRFLTALLFGITARDPATFGLAALFLTVIGLLACLIPARRAMQVDPIETLRYQ